MTNFLAFDLGASSGRAIIGSLENGKLSLQEVHRFAIEYHRSLRTEGMASVLNKIPRVGEKRKNQLLKHFKTIKAIKEASESQLAEIVPRNTAKAVYDYFHQKEREEI